MRDEEYIKMCNQDISANSRQSNDSRTCLQGLITSLICFLVLIGVWLIGLFNAKG